MWKMANGKPRRTALVTGCSEGGLGYALAKAFANEGFHVFATVRNPSTANLPRDDHIEVLPLEVTSQGSIDECVAKVKETTGRRGLDILVNNAGVGFIMPLLDTDIEDSKKLFDVNVWGVLAVTQAFAPMLIEARGTVLNISSLAGAVRMAWQGA